MTGNTSPCPYTRHTADPSLSTPLASNVVRLVEVGAIDWIDLRAPQPSGNGWAEEMNCQASAFVPLRVVVRWPSLPFSGDGFHEPPGRSA